MRFLNWVLAATLLSGCAWEVRGPKGSWLIGAWANQSGRSADGLEAAAAIDWNFIDISARNPSGCRGNPRCGPYTMYAWTINGNYSSIETGYNPADGLYAKKTK